MKAKIILPTAMLCMMLINTMALAQHDLNVSVTVEPPPIPPLQVSGLTIGAFTSGFFAFLMILGFILIGVQLFISDIKSGNELFNKAFIFVVMGLILAGAIGIILTI